MSAVFVYLLLASSFSHADDLPCPCTQADVKIVSTLLPQIQAALKDLNSGPSTSAAPAETASPDWLKAHVGDGDNQISQVVLDRARQADHDKKATGQTSNICYLAMDATRPHQIDSGQVENRLYLVCESLHIFLPFSVSHGSGVQFPEFNPADGSGVKIPALNLKNDLMCVKNFGNANDSHLTTGGIYVTADTKQVFKGKLLNAKGTYDDYYRPFLDFTGEGETSTADIREIGLHPTVLLKSGCYRYEPENPLAKDSDGYIFYADKLTDYHTGRTEGCLGLRPDVSEFIQAIAKERPMAVYVYPESKDINAVAKAVASGKSPGEAGLYWNRACLDHIKTPAFWDSATYDKVIAQAKAALPPSAEPPRQMCSGTNLPTPTPATDASH